MKTSILNTNKYWMSDTFKELILGDIEKVEEYPTETIHSFKLEKNSYDSEILPKVKIFTKEQVLAVLIELTQNEDSILLKDWSANIFYVDIGSCTVVVGARLDGGEWEFYCYELDEGGFWRAGGLVLSPAMVETKTLGTDDTLSLSPLDTSLEQAIKICKNNGLKVYKVETVTKEVEL